jgi:hypothetical protein
MSTLPQNAVLLCRAGTTQLPLRETFDMIASEDCEPG